MRIRFEEWHRQVTRENVVERGNIRRALNGRMPAQRQNASTWPANISEKQLQNRRRANDLHSFGVLRPADGIANCASLIRTRRR